MKYIHFPTLILHAAALLLARLTINDYPGTFLPVGVLMLVVHMVWTVKSKKCIFPSHLLGSAVQFAAFSLGIINVHSGAFGLGGGAFALLFYGIALSVSCAVELTVGLLRLRS